MTLNAALRAKRRSRETNRAILSEGYRLGAGQGRRCGRPFRQQGEASRTLYKGPFTSLGALSRNEAVEGRKKLLVLTRGSQKTEVRRRDEATQGGRVLRRRLMPPLAASLT